MRLACGCAFRQRPDEFSGVVMVITPCGGVGHLVWLIRKIGEVAQALEDVDIDAGTTAAPK